MGSKCAKIQKLNIIIFHSILMNFCIMFIFMIYLWVDKESELHVFIKVWRYQRDKSKKDIKNNGWKKKNKRTNNDLQTFTQKTKDRATRTPLKQGWFGMVGSSCSTCGTHRATLFSNPVISHQWGKNRIVITTNGTYPWSFVTQTIQDGQLDHGGIWAHIPKFPKIERYTQFLFSSHFDAIFFFELIMTRALGYSLSYG
jgi:hypothetical protein